jgi:hypothetical protein
MQCQCPLRLEALNDEAALRFRRSVRDEVAEVNLLQTWDDPVCNRLVRREQQLVNPASRVPAGPVPAHLDKPGPHGFRIRIDGDGVVGHNLRIGHDVIPGKRHAAFLGRGSVGLAKMYQSRFGDRSRAQ